MYRTGLPPPVESFSSNDKGVSRRILPGLMEAAGNGAGEGKRESSIDSIDGH
jgi:hypothetical protein